MPKPPTRAEGRFAYGGLDRTLHEKARLGLLTSLMSRPEGLVFTELKALCQLTDGNLNRHLEALKEEGLVEVWKRHDGRPQTLVKLTPHGKKRFLAYLAELERVLRDAQAAAQAGAAERKERTGWSLGLHPS